jgi:hypothetical protein
MRLYKAWLGEEDCALRAFLFHSRRYHFGGVGPLREERLPILIDVGPQVDEVANKVLPVRLDAG